MECKICGKKFEKEISLKRHITVSYGKNNDDHVPWLAYRGTYLNEYNFSKKGLKDMYVNQKLSTPIIAKKLGVNKGSLLRTMHFYGIKMRNTSEAATVQIARDGLWNKGLTKYDHPGIMKVSKDRMGKNNPFFKEEGFEERKQIILKALKKGRENSNIGTRAPKTTEVRMCKILDSLNLSYVRNFSLKYKDEEGFSRWRLYDFWIDDKVLLEMNGDYWHANPKFYKGNDKVNIRKHKVAREVWAEDSFKKNLAQKNGYNIKIIWEYDFKKMSDKEVVNLLKEYGLSIK